MSQVHAPNPRLVGRADVDLCRRTVAACRTAAVRRTLAALMPRA